MIASTLCCRRGIFFVAGMQRRRYKASQMGLHKIGSFGFGVPDTIAKKQTALHRLMVGLATPGGTILPGRFQQKGGEFQGQYGKHVETTADGKGCPFCKVARLFDYGGPLPSLAKEGNNIRRSKVRGRCGTQEDK